VLYELATGASPFAAATPLLSLSAVLRDDPVPLGVRRRDYPARLADAIDRCLRKPRDARFQSAAELLNVLTTVRAETRSGSGAGNRANPRARPSASRMRRRFVPPLILASVACIGLGAWLMGVWPWTRASAARPRIDSLAVLPLANLSRDQEQEGFVDGMTEALITDLAKIRALRIVSRTSVMRYRNTQKTIGEIAKELNVGAVVEGSVDRIGNRVRVTAQLIRADVEQHLWADSFDREVRDVLLLQDELARTIARQVEVTLTPEDQARLSGARPVDPEAYEFYVKGRYFWNKRTQTTVNKAIDFFRKAIDKDPAYGPAYSGLADCYSSLGISNDIGSLPPREAFVLAREAASKALALQDLAEAHSSLGFIRLNYDWNWPEAEREFKRSFDLNPGYAPAHHWYAHYLISMRRFDEALVESKRAVELDQLNPLLNTHLGWHYYYTRQYEAAIAQLRKTIEVEPDFGIAYWYMGLAHEGLGMHRLAIDEIRHGRDLLATNLVIVGDLGYAYAVGGEPDQARRVIAELTALSQKRYVSPYNTALVYVGLNEFDKAFEWLEKAFRDRSDLLIDLEIDPRLDRIRDDARFENLVRRVGIPK
jgi:TolB-like protein/Flp pilus assembly protein TadD